MSDPIDNQIRTTLTERMRSWLTEGVPPDEVRSRAEQLGTALRERLTAEAADKRQRLIAANERLSQKTGQHYEKGAGFVPNAKPGTLETEPGPSLANEVLNAGGTLATDYLDAMSFGGYRKARDWLGSKVAPEQTRQIQAAENEVHRNPVGQVASDYMRTIGASTPIGAGKIVGDVAMAGSSLVKAPLAKAVVGGGLAGATQDLGEQAVEGAVEGKDFDPWRTVKRTAEGASGGALLHGMEKGADRVLASRGAQARELIERHGGKAGLFTSGKGGPFEDRLAGRKPNDRDLGEVSRESAVNTLRNLEDRYYEEVGLPHHENRARIAESAEGNVLRDATPIYNDLVQLSKSEGLTPSENDQVARLLTRMEKRIAEHDGQIGPYMTETDLNDYRQMLGHLSGRGSTGNPTVAQSKLDKVTGHVKELVDQGPYAETNRQYNEGTDRFEAARNLLGLSSKPSSSIEGARYEAPEGGAREQEVTKLATSLLREGQDTGAAGIRTGDRLEKFRQQYPEYYARELDMPRLLEAKGDLGFKLLPQARGGWPKRLEAANRTVPLLALLGTEAAGKGHGAAAAAAGLAHLAEVNAPAITGRLLHAPAKALQGLRLDPEVQALMAANPVYGAYMMEKLHEMKRAMQTKYALTNPNQQTKDANPNQ